MLHGSVTVIFVGLKFMASYIQGDFKGRLYITEAITQHYFHFQWRRHLAGVSEWQSICMKALKVTSIMSPVQLTGLVGHKIYDVGVIAMSDVSKKF